MMKMFHVAISENMKKKANQILHLHLRGAFSLGKPTLEEAEQLPNSELDSLLSEFFGSVQTNKPAYYSKKSVQAIRFGLQHYFVLTKLVDIITRANFVNSKKTLSK